jgi:hypothetical protein
VRNTPALGRQAPVAHPRQLSPWLGLPSDFLSMIEMKPATLGRPSSGHRLRSIAPRQNASSVAQHDQPTRILLNTTPIDRASNSQVVVPIDDFLLAGAFAALIEQLDGILAFGF